MNNTTSKGVVEILAKEYNLQARPGAKVVCPFCGHKTFSIRSDDTLVKCFYPACGRFITPFRGAGVINVKYFFRSTTIIIPVHGGWDDGWLCTYLRG